MLTRIGLVMTAIYSVAITWLSFDRIEQLNTIPLNELGDFLAGVFGPLAIFWLILGFLQQGKELQQSTRALELQAAELNNSVEQQKELVEVTRMQVEAELESVRYEREMRMMQARPNFVFHSVGGSHRGDGVSNLNTSIKNTGGTVMHVSLLTNNKTIIKPDEFPSWETNLTHKIGWEYRKGVSEDLTLITLSYTDVFGNHGSAEFEMMVDNKGQYPSFSFHRKMT